MIASVGKALILMGLIFLVLGGIFLISGKIPFLGRLPGDIQKKSFGFYFPRGTNIVLSIILSILLASRRSPLGEAEGSRGPFIFGRPVIYHGEASLSVILMFYNLLKK